ncbi:mucin-2-like [Daphnia pulicaria]|uniref:mucin-2-like n=1 Tax=Daphnia pulicaria TaxID=35523 RepID=UPI001EEA6262|nr:mucin-2-like [Daphnia pulicaria]
MAVLLALMAAIAVASVCQAAPVSDPHHSLYRNAASGPLSNNHQSQFDVNLPGFLRVSGQHNYPYGYHPAQAIVPFQPQQPQQQRWLPSRFPTFGGFNPATALIPPLCLPCSNTSWPFFGNQRNSRQNRLLFPSFSLNAAGSTTNNQGSSSATDWMNWWTNPLGFLFPQNPVPQLPTLPFWTTIFCCNSTNNNSTRPATTTANPATTVIPTTTVVPTTSTPLTTTVVPPTTTAVPQTTTVAPPTTTVAPPTTTVAPPTTTVAPPTTTVAPPTTTVAPPTTTVAPPTTTVAPPSTTAPAERSLESGTNSESLPTDTIPLSGMKLLMNLFPPSYISFLRR